MAGAKRAGSTPFCPFNDIGKGWYLLDRMLSLCSSFVEQSALLLAAFLAMLMLCV